MQWLVVELDETADNGFISALNPGGKLLTRQRLLHPEDPNTCSLFFFNSVAFTST